MDDIIVRLRAELEKNADLKFKTVEERFFKEAVKSRGVRAAVGNRIGKKYLAEIKRERCGKRKTYSLCERLWQSDYLDEMRIACIWSESQRKNYQIEDFEVFARWVENYVTNWAACDTLCNHTVGDLVSVYPELAERLIGWTASPNRWVRRAAAVTLIVPGKRGEFFPYVKKIADALLSDGDDMVQKGYGWLLKAASAAYEGEVFEYVMKHKTLMPRTALRYAVEKMPPALRTRAMSGD
jgi:3-methyladenine DNA glycosylase AlkD